MGVESANYLLIPSEGVENAVEVLRSFSATQRSPFPSSPVGRPVRSDFDRWVIQGELYWIDVMVGALGPDDQTAISFRVALSNPVQTEDVLRRLFDEFMARVPGTLVDRQTRRTYLKLGNDAWEEILEAFRGKRAEFQAHFGPFEAAISGEDVFPRLKGEKS